jgi:hypothetical protein
MNETVPVTGETIETRVPAITMTGIMMIETAMTADARTIAIEREMTATVMIDRTGDGLVTTTNTTTTEAANAAGSMMIENDLDPDLLTIGIHQSLSVRKNLLDLQGISPTARKLLTAGTLRQS